MISRYRWPLCLIILATLILRVWGFYVHPPSLDAYTILRSALMAPFGGLPWFIGQPGVPHHFLNAFSSYAMVTWQAVMETATLGGLGIRERLSHLVAGAYLDLPKSYGWTAIYFIPLSLIQIVLFWKLCRRYALSSLMMTAVMTFLLLHYAHMRVAILNVRPDLLMTVFLLASWYTLKRSTDVSVRWLQPLAILFAAAAAMTKYSGGLWLVMVLAYCMWSTHRKGGRRRDLLVPGGWALAGVILFNPYLITNPMAVAKGFQVLSTIVGGTIAASQSFDGNAWASIVTLYPLCALALVGYAIDLIWRRKKGPPSLEHFLVGYCIAYFLVLSRSHYFESHYFLPIGIFMPILIASWVQQRWNQKSQIIVALGLLLSVGHSVVRQSALHTPWKPFAATVCHNWILSNVPTGASIVYDFGSIWLPQNKASYTFIEDEVMDRTVQQRYAHYNDELFQTVYNQEERIELFEARLAQRHYQERTPAYFTYFLMRTLKDKKRLSQLRPDYVILERPLRPDETSTESNRAHLYKLIHDFGEIAKECDSGYDRYTVYRLAIPDDPHFVDDRKDV